MDVCDYEMHNAIKFAFTDRAVNYNREGAMLQLNVVILRQSSMIF